MTEYLETFHEPLQHTGLLQTHNEDKQGSVPALAFEEAVTSFFIFEVVVKVVNRFEIEFHIVAFFVYTKLGDVTHKTKFLRSFWKNKRLI